MSDDADSDSLALSSSSDHTDAVDGSSLRPGGEQSQLDSSPSQQEPMNSARAASGDAAAVSANSPRASPEKAAAASRRAGSAASSARPGTADPLQTSASRQDSFWTAEASQSGSFSKAVAPGALPLPAPSPRAPPSAQASAMSASAETPGAPLTAQASALSSAPPLDAQPSSSLSSTTVGSDPAPTAAAEPSPRPSSAASGAAAQPSPRPASALSAAQASPRPPSASHAAAAPPARPPSAVLPPAAAAAAVPAPPQPPSAATAAPVADARSAPPAAVAAVRSGLDVSAVGSTSKTSEAQELQRSIIQLIEEQKARDAAAEARLTVPALNSSGRLVTSSGGEEGPSHQRPTVVLPKAPLQEYAGATDEMVRNAFTASAFLGIRSLPDALSPDFKARLYEELVESGHRNINNAVIGRHTGGTIPTDPAVAKTGHIGVVHTPGLKLVHKAHPLAGSFATYEYMSSEYGREDAITRLQGLRSKMAQVSPLEFVVKAPPSAPKGAPAFNEFVVGNDDPYEMKMYPGLLSARAMGTGFNAGGCVDSKEARKGMCNEAMAALCKHLSNDWPTSFLQVFEDKSGAIVLSFQRAQAQREGDLSSYMHQLSKTHFTVNEYGLRKDAVQWGIIDADTQVVFYLLWPPWAHHLPSSTPQPLATPPAEEQAPPMRAPNALLTHSESHSTEHGGRSAAQSPFPMAGFPGGPRMSSSSLPRP